VNSSDGIDSINGTSVNPAKKAATDKRPGHGGSSIRELYCSKECREPPTLEIRVNKPLLTLFALIVFMLVCFLAY
jgi:hypothetical protein